MRLLAATAVLKLLLALVCLGSASSYANNPPQGRLVASFSYNADGLRIEKQGERGIERYTYDDQSVLSQRDDNNALVARYTYGPNRLISLKHKTEGTQFYLTDALNSIVDLMTTDGFVQARYQYDAFGNKRSESGSSWNRFAFTGYEEDKETNLLYAKARYYDADTGRFLSQDAWQGDINMPPSLHKYLYSYQNPTVYVDPTGNAPVFNETAQGLRNLADETRATADGLEDNGLNVFSAAGMGLGAGLLDIMGAGTEVVNQGVNLATDAVADKNSSSIWAQESRADLAQTRGVITDGIESGANTVEIIKENPSGAMNAVKDSSVAAAREFASGDTGSVSEVFSALAVAPPVVAGVNASVAGVQLAGKEAGQAAMKLGKNVSNSTMTLLKPNRLKSVAGKELVGKLASDLEQFGHSPEFVARFSHKLRSDLTNEVRSFDPYLARKGAELYDRAKYGKKWRADFDSFVKIKRNDLAKKLKVSPGSIPDDIVFKAISDSSSRGNKTVDMAIFGE